MNSIQACFIAGLIIGLILAGFITYKIEEDRILVMENSQQKALLDAQTKVIKKEEASTTINNQIGGDYAKQTNAVITGWRTAPVVMQPSPSNSLPSVSKSSSGTHVASQNCGIDKTNTQLCKIELSELQKWVRQQTAIYNAK